MPCVSRLVGVCRSLVPQTAWVCDGLPRCVENRWQGSVVPTAPRMQLGAVDVFACILCDLHCVMCDECLCNWSVIGGRCLYGGGV
jgi:hypothetical protein